MHPEQPWPDTVPLIKRAAALLLALAAAAIQAQPAAPAAPQALSDRFTGELGVGAFASQALVQGRQTEALVMPYVYGQVGRLFARVDTFGVKTLPLGNGHLELAARFSTEGFKADNPRLAGMRNRSNPTPLGLATAQRVPYGMVFLHAFYDPASGGALLEGTFGTRLQMGSLKLYPQFGVEHRSREYVNHLYGVSPEEASAAGWRRSYQAPASTAPMTGLAASVPVARDWSLEAQWRYLWLDRAITDSPLAARTGAHRAYVVLAHRFQ